MSNTEGNFKLFVPSLFYINYTEVAQWQNTWLKIIRMSDRVPPLTPRERHLSKEKRLHFKTLAVSRWHGGKTLHSKSYEWGFESHHMNHDGEICQKKKRNRLDSIFGSAKVAHWWNNWLIFLRRVWIPPLREKFHLHLNISCAKIANW